MTLAGGAEPDRPSGEHRSDVLRGGADPDRGGRSAARSWREERSPIADRASTAPRDSLGRAPHRESHSGEHRTDFLSDRELERYSRQLLMPEWTGAAQERLKAASAVVVGAGALGSPAATYLVAAGIGRLGVVDGDSVELSNLHRQPLHMTPDVGGLKAEVAAAKLGLLNPEAIVEPYPVRLEEPNAEAILMGADVVLDCTDSFESRYLINGACCAQGVPLVEAGVVGFEGLVLSIRPGESACYRCAFPKPPPPQSRRSCRDAGVLGAMAGVVGSIQALEALKLLGGVGEPLLNRILQIDGRDMGQTLVTTGRLSDCPACAPE